MSTRREGDTGAGAGMGPWCAAPVPADRCRHRGTTGAPPCRDRSERAPRNNGPMIHPTAEIGEGTVIGAETDVWARTHLGEGAVIGQSCRIGADVYIGVDVQVGDRCKVQNRALLYEGSIIEDEVFVGPAACLTNDRHPRASSQDGPLKDTSDWRLQGGLPRPGASTCAGALVP